MFSFVSSFRSWSDTSTLKNVHLPSFCDSKTECGNTRMRNWLRFLRNAEYLALWTKSSSFTSLCLNVTGSAFAFHSDFALLSEFNPSQLLTCVPWHRWLKTWEGWAKTGKPGVRRVLTSHMPPSEQRCIAPAGRMDVWITHSLMAGIPKIPCGVFKIWINSQIKGYLGTPGWLSRLSSCLQPGSWSQGPGIESHIRLLAQRGACFSLCLPLPLFVLSLFDK